MWSRLRRGGRLDRSRRPRLGWPSRRSQSPRAADGAAAAGAPASPREPRVCGPAVRRRGRGPEHREKLRGAASLACRPRAGTALRLLGGRRRLGGRLGGRVPVGGGQRWRRAVCGAVAVPMGLRLGSICSIMLCMHARGPRLPAVRKGGCMRVTRSHRRSCRDSRRGGRRALAAGSAQRCLQRHWRWRENLAQLWPAGAHSPCMTVPSLSTRSGVVACRPLR